MYVSVIPFIQYIENEELELVLCKERLVHKITTATTIQFNSFINVLMVQYCFGRQFQPI